MIGLLFFSKWNGIRTRKREICLFAKRILSNIKKCFIFNSTYKNKILDTIWFASTKILYIKQIKGREITAKPTWNLFKLFLPKNRETNKWRTALVAPSLDGRKSQLSLCSFVRGPVHSLCHGLWDYFIRDLIMFQTILFHNIFSSFFFVYNLRANL